LAAAERWAGKTKSHHDYSPQVKWGVTGGGYKEGSGVDVMFRRIFKIAADRRRPFPPMSSRRTGKDRCCEDEYGNRGIRGAGDSLRAEIQRIVGEVEG